MGGAVRTVSLRAFVPSPARGLHVMFPFHTPLYTPNPARWAGSASGRVCGIARGRAERASRRRHDPTNGRAWSSPRNDLPCPQPPHVHAHPTPRHTLPCITHNGPPPQAGRVRKLGARPVKELVQRRDTVERWEAILGGDVPVGRARGQRAARGRAGGRGDRSPLAAGHVWGVFGWGEGERERKWRRMGCVCVCRGAFPLIQSLFSPLPLNRPPVTQHHSSPLSSAPAPPPAPSPPPPPPPPTAFSAAASRRDRFTPLAFARASPAKSWRGTYRRPTLPSRALVDVFFSYGWEGGGWVCVCVCVCERERERERERGEGGAGRKTRGKRKTKKTPLGPPR